MWKIYLTFAGLAPHGEFFCLLTQEKNQKKGALQGRYNESFTMSCSFSGSSLAWLVVTRHMQYTTS